MNKYTTDFLSKLEERLDSANKSCNNVVNKLNNNLFKIENNLSKIKNKYSENKNDKLQFIIFINAIYCKLMEEYDYHVNYDIYNKEYHELIKDYSAAYLSGSSWYYGENLPLSNYCNNKYDMCKLYILFIFTSLMKKDDHCNLNYYEVD